MITIDGSMYEGGGQILRTSLACSLLTEQNVEIINIRANRPSPGLKPQHYETIKALCALSGSKVEGATLKSETICFFPESNWKGKISIDIKTAGSITLLLQSILLSMAKSEKKTELSVKGGTDVLWSPTYDYFNAVTLRCLNDFGYNISCDLESRGYYPIGGGEVNVTVEAANPKKIVCIKKKAKTDYYGFSYSTNLPDHVSIRQKDACYKICESKGIKPFFSSFGDKDKNDKKKGSGICLWDKHNYIGASALGARGKKAENVGKEIAQYFLEFIASKAPFDPFMSDQILPYLFLNGGEVLIHNTGHVNAQLAVLELFFGKNYVIEEKENNLLYIKK